MGEHFRIEALRQGADGAEKVRAMRVDVHMYENCPNIHDRPPRRGFCYNFGIGFAFDAHQACGGITV